MDTILELFWELWYKDKEIYLFIGFVSFVVGVILPIAKPFWVLNFREHHLNILIISLIFLVSAYCYVFVNDIMSPEEHYKNGLKFLNGDGFAINEPLAIAALERAAERDHALACRYLGQVLYSQKKGLEAARYWGKGLQLGDKESARLLGELYENDFAYLSKEQQQESAYMAYYQAACLGDFSLWEKLDSLKPLVSQQIRTDAETLCNSIKKKMEK